MNELTTTFLDMLGEIRSMTIISSILFGIGALFVMYEIGINRLADLIADKVRKKIDIARSEKEMGDYIENQFASGRHPHQTK